MDTTTTYPELIRFFLANDDFRPMMQTPHSDGEFIWATDAYIMIRLPLSFYPECPQLENYFDVQSALTKSFKETKPVGRILLADIEKVMSKMPLYDVFEKCKECNGEGEVLCEFCHHTHDCDECYGSGHTHKVIGTEPSYRGSIGLNHQAFQVKYLLKVQNAMHLLNASEAVFHQGTSERTSTHLVIGDTLILLMPNMDKADIRLNVIPL
jgi:hypothetical protein